MIWTMTGFALALVMWVIAVCHRDENKRLTRRLHLLERELDSANAVLAEHERQAL